MKEADSLRGLKEMYVLVSDVPSGIEERALLTKEQIKADVEAKLRTTGVKLLSFKESPDIKGYPLFFVDVVVGYWDERNGFAFAVKCELRQDTYLERNHKIKNWAVTWYRFKFGTGPKDFEKIRGEIQNQVDMSIKDYFSVNP